jgi:rRNA maturation protein Nop10
MHVLGQKCPICGKRGLVIGADDGLTFRPQGWLVKRLGGRQVACPNCGAITAALLPTSVKQLRDALQEERRTEKLTYHARPPRKKSPTP